MNSTDRILLQRQYTYPENIYLMNKITATCLWEGTFSAARPGRHPANARILLLGSIGIFQLVNRFLIA